MQRGPFAAVCAVRAGNSHLPFYVPGQVFGTLWEAAGDAGIPRSSVFLGHLSESLAKNLTLTAGQATKFWPVFDACQKQQNAIVDAQLKVSASRWKAPRHSTTRRRSQRGNHDRSCHSSHPASPYQPPLTSEGPKG
jgi:hypothetical protein